MSSLISDWKFAENGKGKGLSQFLNLRSGNKYRIRLINKPFEFCRYYHRDDNGRIKTAIVADPETCPILEEEPDLKYSHRYGIYVIDRADGKIKVMESGVSVFRTFAKRCEATGINPGGNDGGDWLIEVTGSKMLTRYDVTYLTATPFTDEEKKTIKEKVLSDDKNKLETIFAPDSPEKIREKLFGVRAVEVLK